MSEYPKRYSAREISLLRRTTWIFIAAGLALVVSLFGYTATGSIWWLAVNIASILVIIVCCWRAFIQIPDLARARRMAERQHSSRGGRCGC